ncbi:hypothetical protein CDL15_Pgr019421 [Punica granatum]|uniref:Uncharacterized protein n=1 Tax=Punica granatum TaxID=22663 RepID=A0A218XS33_PUNGR|nr:hypothetical protein CDL15_Pgr019421 [Punica granatum]
MASPTPTPKSDGLSSPNSDSNTNTIAATLAFAPFLSVFSLFATSSITHSTVQGFYGRPVKLLRDQVRLHLLLPPLRHRSLHPTHPDLDPCNLRAFRVLGPRTVGGRAGLSWSRVSLDLRGYRGSRNSGFRGPWVSHRMAITTPATARKMGRPKISLALWVVAVATLLVTSTFAAIAAQEHITTNGNAATNSLA